MVGAFCRYTVDAEGEAKPVRLPFEKMRPWADEAAEELLPAQRARLDEDHTLISSHPLVSTNAEKSYVRDGK